MRRWLALGVGLGIGDFLSPPKMTLAALEDVSLLFLPLADHTLPRYPASPIGICLSWLLLCWACSVLLRKAWEIVLEP